MTAIFTPGTLYAISDPEEETMKVAVHKVTLGIVDHDGLGPDDVKSALENTHYANRCISPRVVDIETKEVDWHDMHPLNITSQQASALRALFATSGVFRVEASVKMRDHGHYEQMNNEELLELFSRLYSEGWVLVGQVDYRLVFRRLFPNEGRLL